MKLTIKRLSVCQCGFPALVDGIGIGAKYFTVSPPAMKHATFICGGCGKHSEIQTIKVASPGTEAGFLPTLLFEPELEHAHAE
jgi:hypothetical protein